jgi:hypothetical protein
VTTTAALAGVLLVAAIVFGLTAGVAQIWSAVAGGPSGSTASAAAPIVLPAGAHVQQITMRIDPPPLDGVRNPLGQVVDGYVPASFTMTAGVTTEVTVYNYDTFPHTWTSAALGVNTTMPAGSPTAPSVTHFLIHPRSAGTFFWHCETPCNAWSMSHIGYMEGYVKVVAA